MTGWFYLILAGLFEIFVVSGIRNFALKKYGSGFIFYTVGIVLSIYLLHLGMETMDASIAYSVYTGIGVAGSISTGMLLWGDKKSLRKLFYMLLLIVSVTGLKLTG
ncbi:SMR family transporter [Pseudescherichia sp.]|uniref:DMT family transporter n=1 Tax=Pseudescherichia sp. TaxID=2055881 RepID=UPI002897630B|nr:SMR family transporter [Pseudescherichia sp.]